MVVCLYWLDWLGNDDSSLFFYSIVWYFISDIWLINYTVKWLIVIVCLYWLDWKSRDSPLYCGRHYVTTRRKLHHKTQLYDILSDKLYSKNEHHVLININ